MTSTELYLRLLRHVRPYRGAFAAAILGMIVVAATEPMLPAIMKPLLDGTFVRKDVTLMTWMPAIILALVIVRSLVEYAAGYCTNWVGNKVVMDLRNAMFHKLIELPAPYYDDHPSGNLISKVTYDVTQVTAAATSVLTVLFKDALAILGLLGWMFWLNWKLTALSLVMTPIIVGVVRLISRRLRRASRDVQQAMGDVTQVVQETVEGHKVVKLFGGRAYEAARFDAAANRVRRFLMKQATAAAASAPSVQFISAVALAVIVYLATLQSYADEITVGGFVSFITAMLMLTSPLKRLTSVNEPLQRGLAAAESVFELIDQAGENDPGVLTIPRATGAVRFEHVTFS
ncbi:MAG TPA: ABC transporter transmembrane domain-containing protein, partial [Burkholderiales bacterium]|nr:ABC transporter transmembrane domain-containing protein [Burkholderiales bacterium]